MISGIFSATFASNLNLGGSGVAIFQGIQSMVGMLRFTTEGNTS